MHDVFNVSLLKEHVENPPEFESRKEQPPKPILVDDEEEYIVEAIQAHKRKHRKLYFLVKWEGYAMDEWTWEPLESFPKGHELLKEYRQANNV